MGYLYMGATGTHRGEIEDIQGYGEFLHGRDESRPYEYIGRGWYHLIYLTPRQVGAQFIAPVFRDIEPRDDKVLKTVRNPPSF